MAWRKGCGENIKGRMEEKGGEEGKLKAMPRVPDIEWNSLKWERLPQKARAHQRNDASQPLPSWL